MVIILLFVFKLMSAVLAEDYCSSDSCLDQDQDENPNMSFIKGGYFEMGTDLPIFVQDGEAPARRVHLPNFLMDTYEVSNAQYAEFVAATDHKTEAESFGDSFVMDKYLSQETLQTIEQVSKEFFAVAINNTKRDTRLYLHENLKNVI